MIRLLRLLRLLRLWQYYDYYDHYDYYDYYWVSLIRTIFVGFWTEKQKKTRRDMLPRLKEEVTYEHVGFCERELS
jgi:hypothetical protein